MGSKYNWRIGNFKLDKKAKEILFLGYSEADRKNEMKWF